MRGQTSYHMDNVSEQRLQDLWPVLADKIRALDAAFEKKWGRTLRVVQGLRTNSEQDALYAQGRTLPGNIVTNATGGHSWHNFGMAADLVPSIGGLGVTYSPDWNPSHPIWQGMEDIGEDLGLTSGAHWAGLKDNPHFQLTGQYPESAPDDTVRQIADAQGLRALWATVQLGE